MKYTQGVYPIVSAKKLNETTFDFVIKAPDIASKASFGQFVDVKADGFFLRRPISLGGITNDTIRIIFEIKGEGTKKLSELKEGDMIDVMGPLGHGFTVSEQKKVILIGGGIGTPPMLPLAEHFKENATVILGFRGKEQVILKEDFVSTGAKVIICTNDGSVGEKGFVTDVLKTLINENPDMIYSCGPNVMLKAVADMANDNGINCEVSLEERMACGVGACLGCACKTKSHDGTSSHAHVCKNGPVFDSKEVIF